MIFKCKWNHLTFLFQMLNFQCFWKKSKLLDKICKTNGTLSTSPESFFLGAFLFLTLEFLNLRYIWADVLFVCVFFGTGYSVYPVSHILVNCFMNKRFVFFFHHSFLFVLLEMCYDLECADGFSFSFLPFCLFLFSSF